MTPADNPARDRPQGCWVASSSLSEESKVGKGREGSFDNVKSKKAVYRRNFPRGVAQSNHCSDLEKLS